MELYIKIFNKGECPMNYMYLIKKITESVNVDNEEVSTIRKVASEGNSIFNKEQYEEQINKYQDGKLKDLYC